MEETRKALSAEMDHKVTIVRAELQQQVNETYQHLQKTLEEIKNEVAMVSHSQERMWKVTSRMGEDDRSIMESAGTENLFSIPENDENPDVPADKDIPLTKGTAGPFAKPSPSFFMNREEPQEEVSSVKDSITSDFAKKNLTEGSTGMWDNQSIGSGKESTLGYS